MSDVKLPMSGRCLCGAIELEAVQEPDDIMYCHCTMCRRWSSGLTTITAKFPMSAVTFTRGQPKIHKTSERGRRGFCEKCGSHISFQYLVADPGIGSELILETDMIYVPVGLFDNVEELVPRNHYCIDTQVAWYKIDDDVPRRGYGKVKE